MDYLSTSGIKTPRSNLLLLLNNTKNLLQIDFLYIKYKVLFYD